MNLSVLPNILLIYAHTPTPYFSRFVWKGRRLYLSCRNRFVADLCVGGDPLHQDIVRESDPGSFQWARPIILARFTKVCTWFLLFPTCQFGTCWKEFTGSGLQTSSTLAAWLGREPGTVLFKPRSLYGWLHAGCTVTRLQYFGNIFRTSNNGTPCIAK